MGYWKRGKERSEEEEDGRGCMGRGEDCKGSIGRVLGRGGRNIGRIEGEEKEEETSIV
jgi:hypothetical protein